ncbi:hypothetical protein [Alexandriicola marinus]|uniref:hypothetical protein n=1 Tax=Alexandriicola marinus TaxID=2081710 RepID=UPI001F0C496A|nr:hypothetical protein [Alexandriicola marinus]
MFRYAILTVPVILAACATPVPDSGAGVGISEYSQYEIERARLEALGGVAVNPGQAIVPPNAGGVVPGGSSAPAPASGISTNDLASAGIGAPLVAPGTSGMTGGDDINRTSGVQASPANAAPVQIASSGISDEQDFDAVASRESIESDAERLARQRDAYQVIQPTALPERDEEVGPNIIEYALNAPNRRGQEWYSRSLLVIDPQGKFQRNCATFRSPDEAQREFLSRGGPERDPLGIDPDGDGFACGWDPAPFLTAVGQG